MWFRSADALVVTSLADGMNLVAKEFVASRGDLGGTLVLSEFAGAAQDLDGALIVNPYDIEAIKRALVTAIEMPAAGARRAAEDHACRRAAQRRSSMGTQLPQSARSLRHRYAPATWRCEPTPTDVVGSDTVRHLR